MRATTERLGVWVSAVITAVVGVSCAASLVVPAAAGTGTTVSRGESCADAWRAPSSPTADRCRREGYAVSARFVVGPRGVVLHSTLPHCRFEDGSGGRRPCTWNIGPRQDGNGIGLAYKVRRDFTIRYVWAASPAVDGWRWVGLQQAYQLAGRFHGARERRSIAAWQRCVARGEAGARVKCPDGARYRS